MTVRDVASRLKTDFDTVRRLTKERAKRRPDPLHSLPSYTLQAKMIRFKRSEVDAWIEARESNAARELTKQDRKTASDPFSFLKRMGRRRLTRLATSLEANLEPSKNIKTLVDRSETTEKIIANVLAEVLPRSFDRNFDVSVNDNNGDGDSKVHITIRRKDRGQELMTVFQVAEMFQIDRVTVRGLLKERAQKRADPFPKPFYPFTSKNAPRWKRSELIAWLESKRTNPARHKPPAGSI